MKERISLNTYRLGKIALQMREFTVNELVAAAGVSKETVQGMVFGLRQKNPSFLEGEDLQAQGPGRPVRRYRLTAQGAEYLTTEIAPFAMELNERAFKEDPSLQPPSLPKSKASVVRWKEEFGARLEPVLPQFDMAVGSGATALLLRPNEVWTARIGKEMKALPDSQTWNEKEFSKFVQNILTPWQQQRLEKQGWTACAYRPEKHRALEVFLRMVSGKPIVELRPLPTRVPTIEELHLSPTVAHFSTLRQGLILVTGIAGSGRNRTLAAMIDQINAKKQGYITTIEEPVRYFHERHNSFIEQRQVAIDTPDFSPALEEALAGKSDVVVLSDIRDSKMFATVLAAAERTLILCRVTAPSPADALNRLVDLFPAMDQESVRSRLAANLVGIIFVTALPDAAGTGTVSAAEVLPWRNEAKECILDPAKTRFVTECLVRYDKSTVTLEESIRNLYQQREITKEVAARYVKNIKAQERKRQGIGRGFQLRTGEASHHKKGKNQHVVPVEDEWGVRGEGNDQPTSIHSTQSEAIDAAKNIAINQQSEVVIHRRDGRIRNKHSYGSSSFQTHDRQNSQRSNEGRARGK